MAVNLPFNTSRKAIFYTLDALIFLFIVVSALFLFEPLEQGSQVFFGDSYVAKDVMTLISELTLEEIDATWVNEQVANGEITDLDTTVLTQLGDFWSKDNFTLAQELANITLMPTLEREQFGIWISDEQVFSTNRVVEDRLIQSWRIISGIDKSKPTKGFLSTARARTISKNQTLILPISPEGAGWDEGIYTITSYFNLSNYTIHDASFLASIHSGTGINDMKITFNGNPSCVYKRNDVNWVFIDSDGNVGNFSINTGCFVPDINDVEIEFRNNDANAHTHPGMMMIVHFETEEFLSTISTDFSERVYFDNIESHSIGNDGSGVWATLPFVIPKGATNVSVAAQIVGLNIRDYVSPDRCRVLYNGDNLNDPCPDFLAWDNTTKPAEDNDYVIFLNSEVPLEIDGSPSSNPTYTYSPTDLAPHLVNGTNIFAVYFNNYLDMVWGNGDVTLYSDRISDPDGSSYVEVNYTLPELDDVPFGAIELNGITEFGGVNSYTKTANFSYPDYVLAGGDVYVHPLQRDSQRVTVFGNEFTPPTTLQFSSPSDRAVPSSIYISRDVFDTSPLASNFIKVSDESVTNEVLNISTIEYFFYLPSYVGFGQVFDTQVEAEDDAKQRLLDLLTPYVTSDDIVQDSQSVNNVPSLWGPVVVEVRSWD